MRNSRPVTHSPSDYNDFRDLIESDAREDWTGVWEVWWGANTRYPHLPLSDRLAIAERVVADLAATGRIRFTSTGWPPDEDRRVDVALDEAVKLLKEWATWVPAGHEGPLIWFFVED